jgi:uncharacterized protein with NRDE domain
MCTVTFIPSAEGCFLTSSRDEQHARPGALPPALYEYKGMELLFPKDAKAGGSWIAFTRAGNAAVLLNGAFENHLPVPPYRKSRGLVFLDILAHAQPEYAFLGMNLEGIEPFTVVLFVSGFLFEARWDGRQKHFAQADANSPHIWSSATLYNAEMAGKRKAWFQQWLTQTDTPTTEAIFDFHRFGGDGDSANSILMNRNGQLLTVSITSIEIKRDTAAMRHFDVKENQTKVTALPLESVML